jgi:hypothetical protein
MIWTIAGATTGRTYGLALRQEDQAPEELRSGPLDRASEFATVAAKWREVTLPLRDILELQGALLSAHPLSRRLPTTTLSMLAIRSFLSAIICKGTSPSGHEHFAS